MASFGDYFIDKRRTSQFTTKKFAPADAVPILNTQLDPLKSKVWEFTEGTFSRAMGNDETDREKESTKNVKSPKPNDASSPRKRHGASAAAEGPVETLTYRDPFAGVYKK